MKTAPRTRDAPFNEHHLETVHFELIGLGQASLGQPLADVFALVALQLQHLAVLGMLDHGTIAGKFLFASAHYLLQVILGRQALYGREGFTSVALLDSYVNESILNVVISTLTGISKGVCQETSLLVCCR